MMQGLFKFVDDHLAELEKTRAAEKLKVEAKRAGGGKLAGRKGKKAKGLRDTEPW